MSGLENFDINYLIANDRVFLSSTSSSSDPFKIPNSLERNKRKEIHKNCYTHKSAEEWNAFHGDLKKKKN